MSESSQSLARATNGARESMEGHAFGSEVLEIWREGNDIDRVAAILMSEPGRRVWKILNGLEETAEAVEGDDARQMFFPTSVRPRRNNRPSRPSTWSSGSGRLLAIEYAGSCLSKDGASWAPSWISLSSSSLSTSRPWSSKPALLLCRRSARSCAA